MRTKKVWVVAASLAAVITGALVVSAPNATASFHLLKVTEVYAGSAETPTSQFVELRMAAASQNLVSGQSVQVFNAAGTSVGTFTFSGNVSNGANQAAILIATPAAVSEFGITSDLSMTAVIPAAGGKVCWASTADCASWGNYSGSATGTGTPFNAAGGIPQGSSMTRKLGTNSTLEDSDDTGDSAADFQASAPTPTNNAGVNGTTTTTMEGATTTTTTTMPGATTTTTVNNTTTTTIVSSPPQSYGRTISLRIENGSFLGRVRVPDGIAACKSDVPVKLQKKTSSGWKGIATRRTSGTGRYSFSVNGRTGRFRTRAPRVDLGRDECLAAKSRAVTRA